MKISSLLASTAGLALAAAALAQPATFTDLGDRSLAASQTTDNVVLTAANNVQWFKVHLPGVTPAGSGWVDIWLLPTANPVPTTDMSDTLMALYSNTGAQVGFDDDDGVGLLSFLTYGSTVSRGGITFGTLSAADHARNGVDGTLADGIYWIGIDRYSTANVTGATAWGMTSGYTGAVQRNAKLVIDVSPSTTPTPPSVSGGTATPSGGPLALSRLLTVTVGQGTLPASPIASVSSDLSAIGGPVSAGFHNDGLNGDASNLDNIWSYQLPSGVTAAGTVTVTATDSLSPTPRSGSGTIVVNGFAATDLGDRTAAASHTETLVTHAAANQVQWFKVVLPAVTALNGWVDIWTQPTANPVPALDETDTEIGLYRTDGTLEDSDDDDGPGNTLNGNWSLLSYGSTASRGTIAYPGQLVSLPRAGGDGTLAGGTYYIAEAHYNVIFGAAFGVTTDYAGTQRTTTLVIDTAPATAPTNPVLSAGAAAPSSGLGGTPVTITVTLTPGTNPDDSAGLVATADLTAFGGGSAVALTHGAGNSWSVGTTIPAGGSADDFNPSVTFTAVISAHDSDVPTQRNANPISVVVTRTNPVAAVDWDETAQGGGDSGNLPGTAQVIAGSGALNVITGALASGDVDMYKINICDASIFEATTRLGTGSPDTQLFLFNLDGTGHAMDDDSPVGVTPASATGTLSSTLNVSNGMTYTNGECYLAVAYYDNDPKNAGGEFIWADTNATFNYNTVRAPDGTTDDEIGGPAVTDFMLASWESAATTAYSYRISLRGACKVVVVPPTCSPADVGIQGGTPGHDRRLDNNDFIVFINLFFAQDPAADLGIQGGTAGTDGLWDNNDFVMFINYFFDDQANCTGIP